MKLSVTFLLILMILPSMTGEKSSKRILRGASLRGFLWDECSSIGLPCGIHFHCCSRCCMNYNCVWNRSPCPILGG
uniref:Conotoxin n=1 Tax=Conus praecellens TaxID=128530 RepID=A0A291C2E5_CONPC|nr:conotoxin [Conus praecellens]